MEAAERLVRAAAADAAELERVRESLPSMAHRRPAAHRWPATVEARA
ncbi:MAG TPA: hypothetical protein VGG40_01160 [Solirubrobacterales bacterium]